MIRRVCFAVVLASLPLVGLADDVAIDKVYHPYVQALEHEIEWRMISADGQQLHRLGFGKAMSDRLFAEVYLIAEDNDDADIEVEAIEIELKWQLSEQGEFAVDWGLITEIEYEEQDDAWELAAGLLLEKEWGRWVGTANIWGIYEHSRIESEFETALALQSRYRYSPYIEPAIEFYAGQNTRSLGPVLMGDVRIGSGKKLHWEAGVIFGINNSSPDKTWRFLAEYEF